MKLSRILMALCMMVAISISVIGATTSLVYAKSGIDIGDAAGGAKNIEDSMPPAGNVDPNGKGPDKGSPLHAFKAIVAAGKKAGDTITTKEFAGMRNWAPSTRGYELQSLVAIGVLATTGTRGKYKLLVDATPEQIDQINDEAKPIVNKISRDGTKTALGIDAWILDANHLGEGKVEQIAAVVKKVTGSNVTPEVVSEDFVKESIAAGRVPASVAINGDISFTIDLKKVEGVDDAQALLAALVETRMVSPEAKVKGGVADFISVTEATIVMFKEELLDKPDEFNAEFNKLSQDETAVIVAINKNNMDIKAALEKAGLLEQWGNRIIVMGVEANSPAAQAFARLFGDNNVIDLRGQAINKILENKNLVEGLQGAV